MEYPKINSLWKRQEYVKGMPKGSHGDLIEGQYSLDEFGSIKYWNVDEKVDGTNIRIYYTDLELPNRHNPRVSIHGRTSDAQLPPHLLNYLQEQFTVDKLSSIFPIPGAYVLYGEGYGAKIQGCGCNYRKDVGFIIFDVFANDWWLKREDVKIISEQIGVPMVPSLGVMNEQQVIDFVKSKPLSQCSSVPQMMEGVVCRSEPLMLFRRGNPVMFKLKCKEFV